MFNKRQSNVHIHLKLSLWQLQSTRHFPQMQCYSKCIHNVFELKFWIFHMFCAGFCKICINARSTEATWWLNIRRTKIWIMKENWELESRNAPVMIYLSLHLHPPPGWQWGPNIFIATVLICADFHLHWPAWFCQMPTVRIKLKALVSYELYSMSSWNGIGETELGKMLQLNQVFPHCHYY